MSRFYILSSTMLILICLAAYGCSPKSNKPIEDGQNSSPPDALMQIEENIDSIISALDKEGKIIEKEPGEDSKSDSQGNSQEDKDGESKDKKDSKSNDGGGSERSSDKSSNEPSKGDKSQENPWLKVDTLVKTLHKNWNEFQPQAIKSGVLSNIVNGFDTDLNTLTDDISVKNLMSTLDNANNLYKYVPEFYSLYKDDSINVKRIKFFIRDIMYKSRFDKWDLASASLINAKNILPSIRVLSRDEIKKSFESLEYEVYNLQKVVDNRQKSIVQIKGNLALQNIKSIETFLKEKAEDDKNQNK